MLDGFLELCTAAVHYGPMREEVRERGKDRLDDIIFSKICSTHFFFSNIFKSKVDFKNLAVSVAPGLRPLITFDIHLMLQVDFFSVFV